MLSLASVFKSSGRSALSILGNSYITRHFGRATPSGTEDNLRFNLETPKSGDTIAEKIVFSGWVASLDGSELQVGIALGDDRYLPLTLDKERLDVANALGLPTKNPQYGFYCEVDWISLFGDSASGEFCLEMVSGSRFVSIGPIQLKKSIGSIFQHERGSYKQVWNEASRNHGEAMLAVAGFANFEEFMESGQSSAQTLKRVLRIGPEDIVLEIGCGTGRIGASLAKECREWIGADISANMIEYARRNLKDCSNVRFQELTGCDLQGFPDNSIDKIYSSAVFMHLDPWDRYRYVKEAYRVVRPGGRVYFDNLNLDGKDGWAVFYELLLMDPAARPPHVSKHSTAEELTTYLTKAGFVDVVTVPSDLFVRSAGTKVCDEIS